MSMYCLSRILLFLLVLSCRSKVVHPFLIGSHLRCHDPVIQASSDKSSKSTTRLYSAPDVTGVTLKLAFDQQWGVADMAETKSERFTSPGSLDMVHRLRRISDCVLVGRSTVERDDCTLTVRRVPLLQGQQQPKRVVIDPRLQLKGKDYKMLLDGLPAIIYHGVVGDVETQGNVTFVPIANAGGDLKSLDVAAIVEDMKSQRGIHHAMVEGGPATAKAFLTSQLVDRAILVRAPMKFQDPYDSGLSNEKIQDAGLELLGTYECDGDTIECWSRPGMPWPAEELKDWP